MTSKAPLVVLGPGVEVCEEGGEVGGEDGDGEDGVPVHQAVEEDLGSGSDECFRLLHRPPSVYSDFLCTFHFNEVLETCYKYH